MENESFLQRQERVYPPQQNPQHKRIADYWKSSTGQDATEQEYSQWGTNIDEQYHQKIRGAIDGLDQSKAHRSQVQTNQAPAENTTATSTTTETTQPPAPASPVSSTGKMVAASGSVATGRTLPRTTLQRVELPTTPMPTYNPATINNNYQTDQFSQFEGPDQSAITGGTENLLQAILANPQTMNPGIVAQLKEKSKEEATGMRDQLMQGYAGDAVRRGTLGSGHQSGFQQQTESDMLDSIINSNRGVDIHAATQNRQDELNAAGAANSWLTGQMGRATSGYGSTLAGQNSQAQANQFGAGMDFDTQNANANQQHLGYESQARANEAAVQRALAQFGIDSEVARFAEASSQFEQGHGLDLQRFLESQRQFNGNLGFNYNQLDQSGNQAMMDWIMRNGG